MVATYYRGRTTFKELMEMPISDFNTLFHIAREQGEKDANDGKAGERQLAEAVEDEMG